MIINRKIERIAKIVKEMKMKEIERDVVTISSF